MSFLKALKSRIKKAEQNNPKNYSEQSMRGSNRFNSRFKTATS